MKPLIHRITDVPAYLDVLRDARQRGLHVRLDAARGALVVGGRRLTAAGEPSGPTGQEQMAVAGRLNDLVREQLWSAFYGTAQGPARPLAAREPRQAEAGALAWPQQLAAWGDAHADGGRWRELQGEAYRQLVVLSPGFAEGLQSELVKLQALGLEAGSPRVAGFASEAAAYLGRTELPMHERLRLMAEAVLPLINEFGYLGSGDGGAPAVRFREAMQKLAQALMLAAGPLEDRRAETTREQQDLQRLQAGGVERQRSDRALLLGRAEAQRLMTSQEGRHLIEQHLDRAIQVAKAAIRQDDPEAKEDSRRLHNGLGQAQDRLLSPRGGETDGARWREAMALAETHRQELESREQKEKGAPARAPADKPAPERTESGPIRALFEQVGALRDTLREMVQKASTHAAAPMRDGAARPAEGRSDESVASESRGHRAAPSGGASAEPAGLAHPSGNTPGNGPLSVPGRRQDGAPSTDPSWSEAAAAVSHAKTGQSVRLDLDRQAEAMDRALDDALPALVRHAGRSSLAAPGKGGAGAADADRLHALMVAYAMAMSECAYIDRHNSRQRLRAACQHIVPHLGVMDTLLASAAAMDDYETVDKLFRLRKCLMVAHGDVQPPYLAFQAVPPPPELFREIGRALAASSMGAGKSSASGGGLLPSQRSALELMVEAGAIIERTVRALLALLQGREGRAAASHPLGPVLHLAVQRMGPAAGVDTLSREGFAIAHALLKSIEAEIGFASSHTPWPQEAELLQRLLEAITRIDALLQHDPILSSA